MQDSVILAKRYGTFFALVSELKDFTLLVDIQAIKKQKDLLWLELLIHSVLGQGF
jgi:hypothetical protein